MVFGLVQEKNEPYLFYKIPKYCCSPKLLEKKIKNLFSANEFYISQISSRIQLRCTAVSVNTAGMVVDATLETVSNLDDTF